MYKGKSFWSTACIVGRVLAAGRGSVECMGWISSDVIPPGHDEGWVDIDVKNINGKVTISFLSSQENLLTYTP